MYFKLRLHRNYFFQLAEDEISVILQYALKGLEYLHFKRKIHRDIKAGNILLNLAGHAKLGEKQTYTTKYYYDFYWLLLLLLRLRATICIVTYILCVDAHSNVYQHIE